MADTKYVKTFKIGDERYDVLSANDNEQNNAINGINQTLQTIQSSLNTLSQQFATFKSNVESRLNDIETQISYESEDPGSNESSNDD